MIILYFAGCIAHNLKFSVKNSVCKDKDSLLLIIEKGTHEKLSKGDVRANSN